MVVALVGGCAALAGGLAFVPGIIAPTSSTPNPHTASRRANITTAADADSSFSNLQGLFGGVALGLLLSLASASPVMAEEAPAAKAAAPAAKELTDEEVLAKGCDIRLDCTTREQQFRWAKAYYRKYNRESDGKDPKYAAASTGAGVYRKFKIDQYIEAPDVVDTTDGTYPIRPTAVAFQPVWEKYNKDLRERVEKVYGKYDEPLRWNQDYYDNRLSPYKPAHGWYNK